MSWYRRIISYLFAADNKEHDCEEINHIICEDEATIIHNLRSLAKCSVSDIMVPRTSINGTDHDASFNVVCKEFMQSSHSKLLLYKRGKDDDHILGYLSLNEILPYLYGKNKKDTTQFKPTDIMKTVEYVPSSMGAINCLSLLRQKAKCIAVVLDEYGATAGIVTKGTLIEELVGNFADYHHITSYDYITKLADNKFKVGGKAEIEELEKTLNLSFSDEKGEYETFAGFILSHTGRIPSIGDKIQYQNMTIEITNADQRKVNEAILHLELSIASEGNI